MFQGAPWWVYAVLLLVGLIAGIVNTVAGGGSFLTLPALMWLGGLDLKLANGTNRIAILPSSVTAVATFTRHGVQDRRLTVRLLIPTMIGVPGGALLAIYLPTILFERAFGVLFLLMAVGFIAKPDTLLAANRRAPVRCPPAEIALFFGIGVYVGFIQAGMGLLLLLGISLFHARDLLTASAVKNAVGFFMTLLAVIAFVAWGQVRWAPGLAVAAGNIFGGYLGAHLSLRKGQRFIFTGMILVMVVTGIKLLWPK